MQTNSTMKLSCEQFALICTNRGRTRLLIQLQALVSVMLSFVHFVAPTSALSAVAVAAAVPVVRVEHGDVATLVLQVHTLLQLLQRLVRAHVGVGELYTRRKNKKRPHNQYK